MKKLHIKKHLTSVLVFAAALGLTNLACAQQQLGVNDRLPALALKDQHDKSYDVPADTRTLLFVADNGATALATQLIESREAGWLARNQQVFLADIHKMPGLIARLVALPKLREKPYPILLGREAADLQMFPRKKDCVTVITADNGRIGALAYACDRDALQAMALP